MKILMAVLALTILSAPPAMAETVDPTPVVVGPEDQFYGVGNGSYVAWTQNSATAPRRYQAYASADGGATRFRLNRRGSQGYVGGMSQVANEVIYQQVTDGQSDIYLYDLNLRTRTPVSPINRTNWEWAPRYSEDYILFAREFARTHRNKIILFNRTTLTSTVLADVSYDDAFARPTFVGSSYAAWMVCRRTCNAWVYDIAAKVAKAIPKPTFRHQFEAVVDEVRGDVYFVNADRTCGDQTSIMRKPVDDLGSLAELIVEVAPGRDISFGMSIERVGDQVNLLFARYNCSKKQSDVVRAPNVVEAF